MTCYVQGANPKTKKALKELKELITLGQKLGVYEITPFGQTQALDGVYAVSGPKYPEPHKWYAQCTVRDGRIVSVK